MEKQIIFLDTETNSLTERKLVQLAYMTPIGDINSNFFHSFNCYFEPKKPYEIDLEAKSVNHITENFLEKRGENLEEFQKFFPDIFKNKILVAHNCEFDKEVLEKNGFDLEGSEWIDTMTLAFYRLKEAKKLNLQYLRYFLNIELDGINPHDALSDVIVLVEVYKKICVNPILDIKETIKGIIYQNIEFGKYAGKTYKEILNIDRQYLKWLLDSELKKENQNKNFINTLYFWLDNKEPKEEESPF